MRIFFDHQIFCEQNFGGISRYYYELIKGGKESGLYTPIFDVKYSTNVFSQLLSPDDHWLTKSRFKGKNTLVRLINKIHTRQMVRNMDFDIYHATYFDQSAIRYKGNKPLIVTVLDMIDEKYHIQQPRFKKLIQHRDRIIHAADHIIAISENTRKDIIDYFNISPQKITTIHLASSLKEKDINKIDRTTGETQYILYVGSRNGVHKNFNNYLHAIDIIAKKKDNIEFVFAGGGNFNNNELDQISHLSCMNRIRYAPIRNDEDIIRLYKNATLLVYPSLYEGFGLPIVEAFSCGVPCATAKGSCLEEVGGDAVHYFDPHDAEDIALCTLKLLNNPDTCKSLVEKGYERSKLFSWEKTVRETSTLYDSFKK